MDNLKVYIDNDDHRLITSAILKLSRLLLINNKDMSIDDLILFNTLLERIEHVNIKMNRELTRKIKRYQLDK